MHRKKYKEKYSWEVMEKILFKIFRRYNNSGNYVKNKNAN